ncbi:hypothetical protein Ccrd_017290 [Cynara cardunculus var. scolymus]|uniref:Uncharacterized protein n=1 Tax=Cynara cardunculus var. scolymus TaxID=59895 RepID=A0A118K2H9_CYNCS|nr:hypothetical protein Ccrd_017290 [Cynara cardunculus var. scolymus]
MPCIQFKRSSSSSSSFKCSISSSASLSDHIIVCSSSIGEFDGIPWTYL